MFGLALGVVGLQRAFAVTPGLYEVAGNPSCANLYQATVISGPTDHTGLSDLGPLFGFKYDDNPKGDVTSTLEDNGTTEVGGIVPADPAWTVTNGPEDPNNSVSIFNVALSDGDGVQFDWSATLGIDAVIVKAQDANAYVYSPEAFGASGLVAPDGKAISHVEFCYDYELDVDKTVDTATYTGEYNWQITKGEDAAYSLFIGDDVTHTYDIDLIRLGLAATSDYAITGTITVANNTPLNATIESVTDVVEGGYAATVSCGVTFPYVLPAGETLECTYEADLPDGDERTNTATVTTSGAVGGGSADADVVFPGTPTEIVPVNITDDYGTPVDTGDDKYFGPFTDTTENLSYTRDFVCPSDPSVYVDGKYSLDTVVNTAEIDETGDSDIATVSVDCYAPVLAKDASASYDERHDWDVVKTVTDPADKFAGETVGPWTWTIDVIETVVDQNFAVSGNIYVTNPAGSPGSITVALADVLDDGTPVTLACGGSVTVAPGATETCGYSAVPDDASATLNTATGTFNSIDFVATAPVNFVTNVVNDEATVSDAEIGLSGVSVSGGDQFTADDSDVCSSNPADYGDNGMYTVDLSNTATLVDFEGNEYTSTATTTYTCYAPVVAKDASASYDERHDWDVSKTVTDPVGPFYPGDEPSWTWTIDITETVVDQNFAVSGNIYVTNPAGSPGSITVALADVLDDGTPVTLACGGSVTVAPGATETCGYTAVPDDASATLNTATGTFNLIDFVATADVNFVKNVVNDSATVSDTEIGLLDEPVAGGDQFTADDSGVCSSDWAAYGEDGTYTVDLSNTATLVDFEGTEYTSTATTSYTCEAFTVVLLKTTNGIEDPDAVWNFELYEGPDGFGTTAIASDSTPPALLDFGGPALRPDTTYTVCELGIPAGWTSFWQLNGVTVIPYNPNADDPTPEDLGNRCVDFGAETTIPGTVGTTISFVVDNSFPGGDPRTPGYWKNWNRCTNGGQQYTADANGGWQEGYWLLEDVLDPNIGGGIVWDDILVDDFVFTIDSCEMAVDILDKRDVVSGKKSASDPLVNLATHLLAAQLNFGAGACTTQDVLDAALEAEELLDKYNFDGTAGLLPKKEKADASLANSLASYLDDYNNGEFCGSTNGG